MTDKPTSLDWLDALLILRRVIDQPTDIRELVERVALAWTDGYNIRLIQMREQGEAIILRVNPVLRNIPKIERVEGLLFAAAGTWHNLHYPGDVFENTPREAFRMLCQRAGCWWGNTPNIRERWRLVDYKTPAHLLPVACFEERERCKICHQPVATGAGPRVYSDGSLFDPEIEANNPYFNLASVTQRTDIHEECMRYVHRILIPARLEQIEAEKRRVAAEVDK